MKFTGNKNGACGDDFYKLSFMDILRLIAGRTLTTGSKVFYFWGHRP